MRIEPLADHLDLVETVARWHWDEWGAADPTGSLASWTTGLRERTRRDAIPTTYIAFEDDEDEGGAPLGSVTLVEHDMRLHPELTPWLAGVYVTPAARRRGVGSALTRHATSAAAFMGVTRLYLYTGAARGFYERLGWRRVADAFYEGQPVTIMAIETGA